MEARSEQIRVALDHLWCTQEWSDAFMERSRRAAKWGLATSEHRLRAKTLLQALRAEAARREQDEQAFNRLVASRRRALARALNQVQ